MTISCYWPCLFAFVLVVNVVVVLVVGATCVFVRRVAGSRQNIHNEQKRNKKTNRTERGWGVEGWQGGAKPHP